MSSSSACESPARHSRSSFVPVPAAVVIPSRGDPGRSIESRTASLTAEALGAFDGPVVESERSVQVEDLFAQVLDLPRAERDAFLAAAPVDDAVRAEVRSLIEAQGGARSVKSIIAT